MSRIPDGKFKNNDFCLVLCCALAVTAITGVIFWLDNETPVLTSDIALARAEKTATQVCAQSGAQMCDLKLVDATVTPGKAGDRGDLWQFEFYSPRQGAVTVDVRGTGDMEVQSRDRRQRIRGADTKS